MNIDLSGKIALVTGGNAGIGRAIAITLAACGAKVAVNYKNDKAAGEEAVRLIKEAGGVAAEFQADVTDVAQVENLVKQVEDTFGGTIDILVNNAGNMIKRVPNAEMTEEQYNKVMDVNFKSTVFVSKAVMPGMKQKKNGKIVNMSSIAAHNGGGPGASVYAASKAAVLSFSKGLAKELAPFNVNVNIISPGFIGQTAFHSTFTSDDGRKASISSVPLGREGVPQDVADAVLYLVSNLSDYLTGETIEINGGMLMK